MQEFQKSKINEFNSPRNNPLIFPDYWSKKTEEDFNLRNPDNINLSLKYTTQDLTNVMNSMTKHVNNTEKVMIWIQEKFIALENGRVKQSIRIDQPIW